MSWPESMIRAAEAGLNPVMLRKTPITCGAGGVAGQLDRETELGLQIGTERCHVERMTETVRDALSKCWQLREALVELGYESGFNRFGELVLGPVEKRS